MVRGLSSADERFLASLQKVNERLATAQRQISSGRRIDKASDQPDEIGAVLAARADLAQTIQINANLGRAKAEVDTAEQAIESSITLLDRLTRIGAQGATETTSASVRTAIAVEAGAIMEQLVRTSATMVNGRYVFGGDSDQVVPYTLVPAAGITPESVSSFNGTSSTREIMHPNGTRFPIGRSAQDIFDSAGASVFQAVAALRDALNNVPTSAEGTAAYQTEYHQQTVAINDALTAISASRDHVNEQLAFYGVVQNRISEATEFGAKLKLRQSQQLGTVLDTDIATAAIELSQADLQRQTSLQARAKITSRSLFDYIG